MTAGVGWIAIALVIFAQWRPWRALAGACLFGGIDGLVLRLQGYDLTVGGAPGGVLPVDAVNGLLSFLTNPQVMGTYPYIATLIVLILATERSLTEQVGAPSALLENYSRELD